MPEMQEQDEVPEQRGIFNRQEEKMRLLQSQLPYKQVNY